MRVFLGGTCSGYDWRKELIPMLKCEYFNPIVDDWTEADRQNEIHERNTCDYVLYTITSDMNGVYSIAEMIDDSNKRPDKTIICILKEGFSEEMKYSLSAVEKLAEENGAAVVSSLEEAALLLA